MLQVFIYMKKIDEQVFIATCQNSLTMAEAARKLGMHFNTFKRYAVKLGCYATNPSGKGLSKPRTPKISTEDILAGNYPDYETYKLKRRLIREGYLEDKCQRCGWAEKRDPEDEFTNMLAVNKKNGIVEQFNPYAEKDLGFFRKLYM